MERFSPRQLGERLTRLRDDLHLAALQYAKEITNSYNYAVDFFIPGKADDRLRDIVEPLFAIAGAAGASDGSQRLTNAMIEVTNKLARIRIAHEADDDAASLIELNALKAIIRTNRRDRSFHRRCFGSFSANRRAGVDRHEGQSTSLSPPTWLSLRDSPSRTIAAGYRPGSALETARAYEVKFDFIKEMMGR